MSDGRIWDTGEEAQHSGGRIKTEVELLHDRIAQRDAELMEWAQRYDDAVQPLQRRCSELLARLVALEREAYSALQERNEWIAKWTEVMNEREEDQRAILAAEYIHDSEGSRRWFHKYEATIMRARAANPFAPKQP